MKKMTPGSSNHAVIDAVNQSIRMLKNRPPDRRRVLLLIAEKRDRGSELRLREALTEAQFANVSIYSLDISTIVAALTDKGMPPRPPSIPAEAQHLPGGYAATPTTVEQNYYLGNYIPGVCRHFQSSEERFCRRHSGRFHTLHRRPRVFLRRRKKLGESDLRDQR